MINQRHSEWILKVFLVSTNPPRDPIWLVHYQFYLLHAKDDKQHCKDVDEIGFCDLMFLMKREVHVVKMRKTHTTHWR